MSSLLIPPTALTRVTPRWLASRIAWGLWNQNYLADRSEVDRSLSGEGLPSLSVTVPDPGARNGRREFLITVEEL